MHSGHMASVEISGFTRSQIEQAAKSVFESHGYTQVSGLVFEKPGSAWETANYGGWSSNSVWTRMRCELVFQDMHQYILGCDAYVVEGHGELGTESERKPWIGKRTDCKALLDEIVTWLNAPSPKNTAAAQ